MDYIVDNITNYFVKQNYISEDKKEIYSYGFKLIFSDIINFSIVLICSLILNDIISGIVFLITLCSIRQFSGGFHAKTFWLCRLSMIITFITVICLSQWINSFQIKELIVLLLNAVSIIIIAIFAPIKHPNKPLNERQYRKNKQKSIITSAILSIISLILCVMEIEEGVTISITISAVVILMIIGLITTKGGEKYV